MTIAQQMASEHAAYQAWLQQHHQQNLAGAQNAYGGHGGLGLGLGAGIGPGPYPGQVYGNPFAQQQQELTTKPPVIRIGRNMVTKNFTVVQIENGWLLSYQLKSGDHKYHFMNSLADLSAIVTTGMVAEKLTDE